MWVLLLDRQSSISTFISFPDTQGGMCRIRGGGVRKIKKSLVPYAEEGE